jgi:hypothetical protein
METLLDKSREREGDRDRGRQRERERARENLLLNFWTSGISILR